MVDGEASKATEVCQLQEESCCAQLTLLCPA